MDDRARCLGVPLGVLLSLAAAGPSPGTAAPDDPLAAYRWRSRVLVLSAPTAADDRLGTQRSLLNAVTGGRSERDLVTLEAVGADVAAQALRHRLGLPADRFTAVLVGKDGGAKLVSDTPISSARLFRVIDAMPMRQDERRSGGAK